MKNGTINVNQTTLEKTKRTITQDTKRVIACSQDYKCNHCHSKLPSSWETDHIIPLFKGGTNDRANLQALCNNCHGKKSQLERIYMQAQ